MGYANGEKSVLDNDEEGQVLMHAAALETMMIMKTMEENDDEDIDEFDARSFRFGFVLGCGRVIDRLRKNGVDVSFLDVDDLMDNVQLQ